MALTRMPAQLKPPVVSVRVTRRLADFVLNASFSMTGMRAAIVGPSGSGKTATLRSIAGLLIPDSGRIVLGERVLYDRDTKVNIPSQNRRVGFVFQQYALFPHMSTARNIAYGLDGMTEAARNERVHEMLSLVGLDTVGNRYPWELSAGQQQRVAVARALAPSPDLLLLDEPLSALDAPLRSRLGEELRRYSETLNIPLVLVTHDMAEAHLIADQILEMDKGELV